MAEEISRKLNVLEMHSSFGYAGGQRNMFTFAKYLDKRVFNVFAASYKEGGVQEGRLKAIGVECVSAEGDAEKILNFIKEKKIDCLHIHRSGGTVEIESKIIQGAKKINNEIVIIEKNIFGKFDKENDHLIDCSFFQSMMHLNERYLPAAKMDFDFEKMKVMYNMVDSTEFEKYRLTDAEIAAAKVSLGISPDDFVIGKIARPDLAKWSDLVIDAAKHLGKLVPNFKFLVIGVPKSRVELINGSDFLKKHFIILNASSDEKKTHTFYQVIDVLGHSSKIGECNGNTINEAMYWKKPVITNSTPKKDNGQLEQIDHMENGIIANHPQTFARAVAFLHDNPEISKKMGESAHSRVAKFNNPSVVVRRVEKFFVEKLAKKGMLADLSLLDFYGKIDYLPSKEEIVAYKDKYQAMLKQDYGYLSKGEVFANVLVYPHKFYFKVKDYLQHKLKI